MSADAELPRDPTRGAKLLKGVLNLSGPRRPWSWLDERENDVLTRVNDQEPEPLVLQVGIEASRLPTTRRLRMLVQVFHT